MSGVVGTLAGRDVCGTMTGRKVKAVVYTTPKLPRPPKTRWELIGTYWQLPCGCINPDIWNSEQTRQAYCTSCGRGWWHMGAHGSYCQMLDGKPQGAPVLVLTEKFAA